MIEAKKMMEEAIASGGKASDVYLQARKEMNKLADIKDNTVRGLAELRRNGASEQEIEDYVEAANIMLRKSGIEKGLMSPRMMKERFDEYLKKEDNK